MRRPSRGTSSSPAAAMAGLPADGVGGVRVGPDLGEETPRAPSAVGARPEEQVPDVLEERFSARSDRRVLAVVVEAPAPDVADLGLGHDHAGGPLGA